MSFNLDVWKLLAGLGIFLFGMFLIEESVKVLSGRAFGRLIRMYTNGKVRSIVGSEVTAAKELYARFGDKLPQELTDQLNALKVRLNNLE